MDTGRTGHGEEARGIDRRSPRPIRYEEIIYHTRRGRQLRAEETARMLDALFHRGARLARAAGASLARWERRHATRHRLMAFSDRRLEDVGIAREDIPLVAKGIDPRPHDRSDAALRRRWHDLRLRAEAMRRAHREWRRIIHRELMAYDERERDELGVRPSDVRAIATGQPVPRAAG